jgi:hypothetical protein
MKTQTGAYVYRFGGTVAMHTLAKHSGEEVDSCPTIYLPPEMAREIGKALIAGADNVEAQPKFGSSTFGGVKIGNHE